MFDKTNVNLSNPSKCESYCFTQLPQDIKNEWFRIRSSPIIVNPINILNPIGLNIRCPSYDWFKTMPEPIKVNNRHLVNITKPVGINPINFSHKNTSYDFIDNQLCTKLVASPIIVNPIDILNPIGLNISCPPYHNSRPLYTNSLQSHDWFEIVPEPIKLKNRHLVNVTKPIGY